MWQATSLSAFDWAVESKTYLNPNLLLYHLSQDTRTKGHLDHVTEKESINREHKKKKIKLFLDMKMSYTCWLASTISWGGNSSVPISRTNNLEQSTTWEISHHKTKIKQYEELHKATSELSK